MVLLIIIPIKWLFHWEYTLFSDKPTLYPQPLPNFWKFRSQSSVPGSVSLRASAVAPETSALQGAAAQRPAPSAREAPGPTFRGPEGEGRRKNRRMEGVDHQNRGTYTYIHIYIYLSIYLTLKTTLRTSKNSDFAICDPTIMSLNRTVKRFDCKHVA